MTTPPIDEPAVLAALRTLQDPEFGIDLVELGLIYEVKCSHGHVHVIMTLTTEACPAGSWIYEGVKSLLGGLPGVTDVQVDLVFEPRWSPALLGPDGRRQLGLPPD